MNPSGIAISPDGETAYVTSFNDTSPAVMIVNIASRSITSTIPLNTQWPHSLALTPDVSELYVAYPFSNQVDIIDTLTGTDFKSLNIGAPYGIAFSPNGTLAYIASGAVAPGTLAVLDTASLQVVKTYNSVSVINTAHRTGHHRGPAKRSADGPGASSMMPFTSEPVIRLGASHVTAFSALLRRNSAALSGAAGVCLSRGAFDPFSVARPEASSARLLLRRGRRASWRISVVARDAGRGPPFCALGHRLYDRRRRLPGRLFTADVARHPAAVETSFLDGLPFTRSAGPPSARFGWLVWPEATPQPKQSSSAERARL